MKSFEARDSCGGYLNIQFLLYRKQFLTRTPTGHCCLRTQTTLAVGITREAQTNGSRRWAQILTLQYKVRTFPVVLGNFTKHVHLSQPPFPPLKKWKRHRCVTALLLAAISDHRCGCFVPRDRTPNTKCRVCRNPQPLLSRSVRFKFPVTCLEDVLSALFPLLC